MSELKFGKEVRCLRTMSVGANLDHRTLKNSESLSDLGAGASSNVISTRFHNGLVEAILAVAHRIGHSQVCLSGGCFQNRFLTERAVSRLRAEGFRPYWHQRVPPNDGGISLGQVIAALGT